jgi:hypothetical protein
MNHTGEVCGWPAALTAVMNPIKSLARILVKRGTLVSIQPRYTGGP